MAVIPPWKGTARNGGFAMALGFLRVFGGVNLSRPLLSLVSLYCLTKLASLLYQDQLFQQLPLLCDLHAIGALLRP